MSDTIMFYSIVFIFGITIGSFLNVCMLRIPAGGSIVTTPSSCPKCHKRLMWYELVPILSWIALRGKCKSCKSPISKQYPLVELINGLLWVLVVWGNGFTLQALLYCFVASALFVIAVIDERTQEIPVGLNIFIGVLGAGNALLNLENISTYIIGFFVVSGVLTLVLMLTSGRGIGGGDIKLMAVCGLLLGWKLIILAFFIGCILGSIIHISRMKLSHKSNILAFGPYLAMGVFISMNWGNGILQWYFSLFMLA